MHKFAVIAGAITLLLSSTAIQGQTLKNSNGPANFPPTSYAGTMFVDSAGCVFIRAGKGNRVTWVPRVTRSRQMVCGQRPTAVGGAASVQTATLPRQQTVQPTNARQIAVPTSVQATNTQQVAAANTSGRVRKSGTFPPFSLAALFGLQSTGNGAGQGQLPSQPTNSANFAVAAVQPRVQAAPQAVNLGTRQLFRPFANDKKQIRQNASWSDPYTWVQQPVLRDPYSGQTVTRQGVQTASANNYMVLPEGYQSVYKPGRLNTRRGVGNGTGDDTMNLVWTQTVPRRLINVSTGRDVTNQYQLLQYPFTSSDQQQVHYSTRRSNWVASSKNQVAEAVVAPVKVASFAAPVIRGISNVQDAVGSTISAKPARGNYVQVATFGVPANATRTTAKFAQLGLPTRARSINSKGRVLQVVMLGPFDHSGDLNAALMQARSAGFADAFATR
jgi:hypothetical protein